MNLRQRIRFAWLVARHGEAWARARIALENFEKRHASGASTVTPELRKAYENYKANCRGPDVRFSVTATSQSRAGTMPMERCEHCHFVGRTKVEHNGAVMSRLGCRRHAPAGDGNQGRWQWPPVEHSDWCGDFKPINDATTDCNQ